MMPTASKMLKEVSKFEMSSVGNLKSPTSKKSQGNSLRVPGELNQSVNVTASQNQLKDTSTKQVGSNSAPKDAKPKKTAGPRLKSAEGASPKKKGKSTRNKKGGLSGKKASRVQSEVMMEEGSSININLNNSVQVPNIDEIQTTQSLLEKKNRSRGKGPNSSMDLKNATERMEKEFYDIMNELEMKRSMKNNDWYSEQVSEQYANSRKNQQMSITGKMQQGTKNAKQAVVDEPVATLDVSRNETNLKK